MNGNVVDYKIIGKRLRGAREAQDMTQGELANGIGVCTSYIGQLERGEKKPSIETIVKVCSALNIPVDYLLFGRKYPCDIEGCELVREIDALIHGDEKGVAGQHHLPKEDDLIRPASRATFP